LTASDSSNGAVANSTSPLITVNAGPFAKLQILAPGETASPGSSTGKTGTPAAQTASGTFQVTVNAVDANWNFITGVADNIGITSSDVNAVLPTNAALINGSQNFSVTLKTAGSATITASDIGN